MSTSPDLPPPPLEDDTPSAEPPPADGEGAGGAEAGEVADAAARVADDDGSGRRVIEIVQTVLMGLILAFIFRAFLVEAFIIPTGSMAESLLGAHAKRCCPACGWVFAFAPLRAAAPSGAGFVCPPEALCPNCQLRIPIAPETTAPQAGDRVLVHKWPFALGGWLGPQRWDVIVFRDPGEPTQHYIKRLVGLPGESIEIIDGDVFINGRIARKPEHVQALLWAVVFDQAYLPEATAASGGRPRWVALDPPEGGSRGWSGLDARVIEYDGLDARPRRLIFNPDAGPEYLLDFYGYNRRSSGATARDLRVTANVGVQEGAGSLRVELTREPQRFVAEITRAGEVRLARESTDDSVEPREIGHGTGPELRTGRGVALDVGHVDGRFYVKLDGRLCAAYVYSPDPVTWSELGGGRSGAALVARGLRLELTRLRLERDVHYTTRFPYTLRATAGAPFLLHGGEYFVLGDNSPDSHDSREWSAVGPHLPCGYRTGTVPADEIVGQAAFVYLPGLLPLDAAGRWHIPDIGRVRFVR